ncbi:MAG: clostripain-related cysteine peptidase [Christensenellales bacterium]
MKKALSLLLVLALMLGLTAGASQQAAQDYVIFVYLCGTDLESEGGAASSDLKEMMDAGAGENVRFVVQTGGTRQWAVPEAIPADRISRFDVHSGDIFPVFEGPLQNMGEAGTLRDFLAWGLQNYQAQKYGLIIWNHGSGSINGVAFDELYDNDSLSLMEINEALRGHEGAFEFIGFDACLMATVETAQAVLPYARYMIASEELEPGSGWDYQGLGSYLAGDPGADGAQLGKVIADGFLASNIKSDDEAITTMSVTDLSKLPALTEALDAVGWQMVEVMTGGENLSAVVKGIHKAENYGGNTPEEGYTNMVDIGAMMRGVEDILPGAAQVLAALQEAVVYRVAGSGRQGSTGLSTYYPLKVQGSQEYQIFKQASPAEGYRRFVAGMLYGAEQGDTTGLAEQAAATDEQALDSAISALDEGAQALGFTTDENSQIKVLEAYLDAEGVYTLALQKESMEGLLSATFTLLMDEGEGVYYSLGEDDELIVDETQGLIQDAFDGSWTALPDGQLLSLYLIDQGDEYNLYSAPVKLNGRETNLRILYDFTKEAFQVIGGWDGISQSGAAGKEIIKVSPGDAIIPLYEAYDGETDDYLGQEEGEAYLAEAGFTIDYLQLPAADYYYGFTLTDLYGLETYTDFVLFTVDEAGEIWFGAE